MGGGGGSFGGISDIDKLEDIAREELRKETPKPRRKVFISFVHEDKNSVDLLRGQAKNENSDLDFIDMSLQVPFNSENAEYIQRGIRERIKQSSVTVVLVSDKTHESDWVNWEISESLRLGKGVVVVNTGDSSTRMPNAVIKNRDQVKTVQWKHQEMMDAINKTAENR